MLVCVRHERPDCKECAEWGSAEILKARSSLEWIAKGWLNGSAEFECKTVGNGNDAVYGPGHHCLVCWMYEAQRRAQYALGKS